MDRYEIDKIKDKIEKTLDSDFPNPKIRGLNNYGVRVLRPDPNYGFDDGEIIAVFKTHALAQKFIDAGFNGLKLEIVGCARWMTPGMFDIPDDQLPKCVMDAWSGLSKKEHDMYYSAGLIGGDI